MDSIDGTTTRTRPTTSSTSTTIARDKSTSVTGLVRPPSSTPIVPISPPTYLGSSEKFTCLSQGAISIGTRFGSTETLSHPIVPSPEQPVELLQEKQGSPKPCPQVERSSTDGSNPEPNYRTSQQLRQIGQDRLGGDQQGCQKHESVRQIRSSDHHIHPTKLFLDQNCRFPIGFPRSMWYRRPVSTANFYLAYCATCQKFVYVW